MIKTISISNYALIEKTEILPAEGFNVITGETGAGKSILLGAVGLTLGQRADAGTLIDKNKKCVVEVEYDITDYSLRDWFDSHDLDYDHQIIVRREVAPDGKSRAFINDTPVNNKALKDFGNYLIDVHSQHQSLLISQPEYQIDVLDVFAGNKEIVREYRQKYDQRKKKESELKQLKEQADLQEKEKDYMDFQLARLEAANLREGEKEDLEEELSLLNNAEGIKSAFHHLTFRLRDMDNDVIGILKNARNNFTNISDSLKDAEEFANRLDSIIIELKDMADEGERITESIEYHPGRVEEINTRLNTIYELIFKYKAESVSELLTLKDDLIVRLDNIRNSSEVISQLENEIEFLTSEMKNLADQIHSSRDIAAEKLCEKMKTLLIELGIRHADFRVTVRQTDQFFPTGTDEVAFLFSANKNQEPGDISKVASGGEISRVMLALKYILSSSKQLPVIIFDEIDTGLSGEVAHKMAMMMKEMATRMQVISISHLPQIASSGERHFKVYKEDSLHQTVSRIKILEGEERVTEIAGMMSGADISKAAMETARTLLGI